MKTLLPAAPVLLLLLLLPSASAVESVPGRPGLENLFRVDAQLYSGGEPGEGGFASLKALGVTTVISVDGLPPDLDSARAAGMECIHIPIGYDGPGTDEVLKLAAAVRTRPGPVYVHCHHGKHRGPAAAAIAWQCRTGTVVTTARALELLTAAGTDPGYDGLFAAVRDFQMPDAAAVASAADRLVPAVEAQDLASAMAGMDRHWERVKAVAASGWVAPPGHPDLVPAREALMTLEGLREAKRLREDQPAEFRRLMEACIQSLVAIESGLRTGPVVPARLDQARKSAAESCTACHRQFRD